MGRQNGWKLDDPTEELAKRRFTLKPIPPRRTVRERREHDRSGEHRPQELPPVARLPREKAAPVAKAGPHGSFQDSGINRDRLDDSITFGIEHIEFCLTLLQTIHERRQVASGLNRIGESPDLGLTFVSLPLTATPDAVCHIRRQRSQHARDHLVHDLGSQYHTRDGRQYGVIRVAHPNLEAIRTHGAAALPIRGAAIKVAAVSPVAATAH